MLFNHVFEIASLDSKISTNTWKQHCRRHR